MNEYIKNSLKNIRYVFLNIYPVKNNFCCLCELKVIGSDLDNFSCRVCDSHDRERHLWLYMKETGLSKEIQNSSILHFAPEKHLSSRIENLKPKKYIKPTFTLLQVILKK